MTSVMSGKTQLEFQLPPGSNGMLRYHGNVPRYPGNRPPNSSHTSRPFALQKQNQLAFNVNMAAAADSLTKRYRKPSAVVVEKLGTSPTNRNENSPASIRQISLLSQDKLSQALFLAKRDVSNAKRRRNDQVLTMADVAATDSVSRQDSEQENSVDVTQERQVERIRTQQQERNREVTQERKSKKTSRKATSEKLVEVSPHKQRRQDIPASPGLVLRLASDSPVVTPGSPGDRQARQVGKLQRELQRYIRELEGHLRQGQVLSPSKRKRRGSVEKISDTEDDPRTEVRRQEQLTRAGRMVYTLQHQTQLLKKLGSAHRAAVKVLQVFIQQLPDQYSGGGGLPPVYQLSQLSAQLQVGSSEVTSAENLLHLLGRAQLKPRTELPAHKRAPEGHTKVKTRPRRPVWKDRPGDPEREDILRAGIASLRRTSARRPAKGPRLGYPTKRTGIVGSPKSRRTPRRPPNSPIGEHTLASLAKVKPPLPYMGKENRTPPSSPLPQPIRYREQSLSPKGSPLNPHKSPRLMSGARRSLEYREPYRRRREEISDPSRRPTTSQDAGRNLDFLETHRNPEDNRSRHSPDFRRNVDLRVMYENPDIEKTCQEVPEGASSRLRASLGARRSLDMEGVHGGYRDAGGREPRDVHGGYEEAGRLEHRDVYGGFKEAGERGGEWKGVYRGFQDAGMRRNEPRYDGQYFDRRKELGDNLPTLRNGILEEVIEDTSRELQRLEGQRSARQEAMALQDMSTLNNILQKLQLVEEEEEAMRRRWIRAEYANEMDHIWTRYRSGQEAWAPKPSSQSARSPEGRFHDNALELLSFRQESVPSGALHTTAVQPGVMRHSTAVPGAAAAQPGARHLPAVAGAPPVLLFTPAAQMQDLRAYRRSFDQHRRRTSHETAGEFNPWKLVDQLADELMEDVLDTVVMEMTDACQECVENVYRSEFT
ncbi:PREDICTED: protein moonraker-like [Branchiostoma belcheri]|uniref:Protein moonraker-like n=1 Tax=Branchiostoma belcheri TaxID=7741 RepID=A0A6P4Y2Y1_BRABE|nr:PREDICTED: protein moonraker-like [Branchiostoma belcheri]